MATLLGTRSLVLDVNTSGTALNEKLGELQDSSQTTMASVGIGNDRSQVVDIGHIRALVLGSSNALLTLFSVMEQLCHEELVDFAGDSVLKVC